MPNLTRCKVIYQDKWIICVNKPEGFLSHPNPAGKGICAFEGRYHMNERRFETPEGNVWLLHRIDQDTSGALLAAFDQETAKRLRNLMDLRKIDRNYLTLVAGMPPRKGKWADRLEKKSDARSVRSYVRPGGKLNAELRFSLKHLYRRTGFSLLEIELISGKTHQIRVQAAHRHFPLAGDSVYGNFALNRELRKRLGLRRLFLHASSLVFHHPHTGRLLKIQAPLPPELVTCLSRLN